LCGERHASLPFMLRRPDAHADPDVRRHRKDAGVT
jgi:hypothetical protein